MKEPEKEEKPKGAPKVYTVPTGPAPKRSDSAWKASVMANAMATPAKPQPTSKPPAASPKAKPKGPPRVRVSSVDVANLLRRFLALLEAGVPLVSALGFLSDSEENAGLRQVLEKLTRDVSSGHRFSDAMRAPILRSVFSSVVINLIMMGEQTGNLAMAVSRAADLMDAQIRIQRALVTALTYPSALLIAVVMAAMLFVSILGADGGLFSMLGDDLPLPTRIMVATAKVLRQPWLIGLGLALVVGLLWGLGRLIQSNATLRLRLHWAILQVPGLGTLVRKTIASRMLYVMSNCIIVGLPMVGALKLMRNACTNESVLQGFDYAYQEFVEGVPLSESLEKTRIFPMVVPSMMSVAEETGTLDQILEKLAAMLEDDVMTAIQTAMLLFEPILLMFAGCLAGFLAIATLLPIINLAQKF